MAVKSDIEIAQEAKLLNINDVAAKVGVTEDELEMYGKYKASYLMNLYTGLKTKKMESLFL